MKLKNLKSVDLPSKTVNYKVDAHNRRFAKYDGTTLETFFVWNSKNQLIGLLDSSGNLTDRYVYGSKSHVPDYVEKGSDKFMIVTDHLGSPVQVINVATGVVAQEVKYDEFGKVLSDTNPGFIAFGFAGCLYDQDTKLCRFGARDYDSSIGRWLSKDPILFSGGDTNLYGYVFQDPINYIDPNGKYAWGVILGLSWVVDYVLNPKELNKGSGVPGYSDRRLDMYIPGDSKYNDLKLKRDADEIIPNNPLNPTNDEILKYLRQPQMCS